MNKSICKIKVDKGVFSLSSLTTTNCTISILKSCLIRTQNLLTHSCSATYLILDFLKFLLLKAYRAKSKNLSSRLFEGKSENRIPICEKVKTLPNMMNTPFDGDSSFLHHDKKKDTKYRFGDDSDLQGWRMLKPVIPLRKGN